MNNLTLVSKIRSDLKNVECNSIGLMSENGLGNLLFLSYDQFVNNFDHQEKIVNDLKKISDLLNHGSYLPTFCSGISGLSWLLNHLETTKILRTDSKKILKEADHTIFLNACKAFSENKHDFLHGGLGDFVYLISRLENKTVRDYLRILFEKLRDLAIRCKEGIYWTESQKHLETSQKINLGLAHGQASKISILSHMVKCGFDNVDVKDVLKSSIDFMLSKKNISSVGSVFSNYVSPNNESTKSRIAWCYGDLGIGMALWNAAEALNCISTKQESLQVFRSTFHRMNSESAMIDDAGICHGTSGIALVYNRMFLNTGLHEFKAARDFWLTETFKLASYSDGIGGYKTWFPEEMGGLRTDSSLLSGTPGIALALLTCQSTNNVNWDRCLLLT